ncbi:MAG: hypothetical protein SGPRY_001931 [Prymnesium sp.]
MGLSAVSHRVSPALAKKERARPGLPHMLRSAKRRVRDWSQWEEAASDAAALEEEGSTLLLPFRPVNASLYLACAGKGVWHASLRECRCTAGWGGAQCEQREERACNSLGGRGWARFGTIKQEALCAGNCDTERGLCYCAGLERPFQRPLPHLCSPWAHITTRLPDGRPAYPVLRARHNGRGSRWRMASLLWGRARGEQGWARLFAKPFQWIYGEVEGNPSPSDPKLRAKVATRRDSLPYCRAPSGTVNKKLSIACSRCYEGTTGPLCELPKRSYCLRDCSDNGWCDSGFCWCEPGWFGIDCSQQRQGPPKPSLQEQQGLLSPSSPSPLRVYVYDMPSMFTTRNLQWRNEALTGLYRTINGENRSHYTEGSLYAMELALHEWLLDSPLRTTQPESAHLFFVPIYAASLFMWPISHFADEPFLGREQSENRRRSHQGALLLKAALHYIRTALPFWNASGGRDHVWMMLHDEGPCFCPRELRSSSLLTHYGYWAARPRPWGTYYDDNFLQAASSPHHTRRTLVQPPDTQPLPARTDLPLLTFLTSLPPPPRPGMHPPSTHPTRLFAKDPRFYARHIGDPSNPTPCFNRERDIVIPPWKAPSFWARALQQEMGNGEREGLVFFAGDLGFNRLKGYSHDLRQWAHSMFCDPRTTKKGPCTPTAQGCRPDLPLNCSRWEVGVKITTHSRRYHDDLRGHIFCLAFPGDGWSSRVLDAVVHGCIPVVVQDESYMFFEGAFEKLQLGLTYHDFSVRVAEKDLPSLVQILRSIPPGRISSMRSNVLLVRDYFVYKDMYNPSAQNRRKLLSHGRQGQDAFLLLALALETRARALGRLDETFETTSARVDRIRKMLGFPDRGVTSPHLPGNGSIS